MMKLLIHKSFWAVVATLFIVSTAWAADQIENQVTIKWKPVPEAASYVVQLLDKGDKVVVEKKTKLTQVSVSVDVGNYAYRVQSVDAGGTAGPFSAPQAVEVAERKTEDGKTIRYAIYKAPSPAKSAEASPEEVEGNYDAEVVRSENPKERIDGLSFRSGKVDVSLKKMRSPGGGIAYQPVASLRGEWKRAEWSLLWRTSGQEDENQAQGKFARDLPLEGRSTAVDVMAIGPRGEVEKERFTVTFVEFDDAMAKLSGKGVSNRHSFAAGIGPTFLSYKQTNFPDFTETLVTAKFQYRYLLSAPRWDLAANLFYAGLPLSTSLKGVSISFLGFNARVGYTLPQVKEPWKVSILGGYYYTTTFVSGASFGYENLQGPQLFPTVTRFLSNGDTVSGYFKFSTISNGLSPLALTNHELAFGGGWTRPLKNGHPVSAMLDIAMLSFEAQAQKVQSTTFSISGGYGF